MRPGPSADKVLVIGLGNPDRGDDGIGPLVARRLEGRLDGAEVMTRRGDALALIQDWAGAALVLLIDASAPVSHPVSSRPGSIRPGSIRRIDLVADGLPRDLGLSSTHAFGMADALALARTLRLMPPRLVVYAVEGQCFEPGAAMTPAVAAAAAEVAAMIADEVRAYRLAEESVHA